MITDERAEQANDFIRENADAIAKAKADRLYLEHFIKTKRSLLFLESGKKTVAEREHEAQSHEDYIKVLHGYRIACELEESLKWKMNSEAAIIDIWRTQQASSRKGF